MLSRIFAFASLIALVSALLAAPPALAEVDTEIRGIWVRELREGGASLYLGSDGRYFLIYVGASGRRGTFGAIDAENGSWRLTDTDGKSMSGTYRYRPGDRLIWIVGNESAEWRRPEMGAARSTAVQSGRSPYDKDTMLALSNDIAAERRIGARPMLASAGNLLADGEKQISSASVTDLPGGGSKLSIGGTHYYYYHDGTGSVDSGDPLADAVSSSLMNGRYDEALAASDRMIARDPNAPNSSLVLAEVYFRKGNYYAQISAADRAISLASSGWIEPDLGRGFHRSYQAEPQDAAAQVRMRHTLADGYRQRGIGLFFLGSYQEAVSDFNRSVSYRARPNADVYFFRGQAFTNLSRYREALDDFTEASRLDPKRPMSYCLRALAHRRLGDQAAADADLAQVRAFHPDEAMRCSAIHG